MATILFRRNLLGVFITLAFFIVIILLTVIPFGTLESKSLWAMRNDKTLGKRINDFALEDQFENRQTAKFFGKHTFLMIGDRKGLEIMRVWEEQLQKQFGNSAQILRVAYFRGMPFFVPRSLARNEVKEKHPKVSVMLDWDGNAGEQFGYEEGCSVYYLDASAVIRASAQGEATPERFKLFAGKAEPSINTVITR